MRGWILFAWASLWAIASVAYGLEPSHGGRVLQDGDHFFEVVREDNGLRVYLYDKDGNPIDPVPNPGRYNKDYVSGTVFFHLPGSDKGTRHSLQPYDDESLRAYIPDIDKYDAHQARVSVLDLPGRKNTYQRWATVNEPSPKEIAEAARRPPPPPELSSDAQSLDVIETASAGKDLDVTIVRDGDALFMKVEAGGEEKTFELQGAPQPEKISTRTRGGTVFIQVEGGGETRMFWARIDPESPGTGQVYDGSGIRSWKVPDTIERTPQILVDDGTTTQTIGADGYHYTQLRTGGGPTLAFRWVPGGSTVKVIVTAGGEPHEYRLPLDGREFKPRLKKTKDGQTFVSLDDSSVSDLFVMWDSRSGRKSLPYLDRGNIVLKPARWSYQTVLIAGNDIGTDSWTVDTSKLDRNFIRPPHWRPFSNGFVTGWLRKDDRLFIRNDILYANVQGARVAEALFEQTAIWSVRSIPVAGNLVMIGEAVAGTEIVTGRQMGTEERILHGSIAGIVFLVEAAPAAKVLATECRTGSGAAGSVGRVGSVVDEASSVVARRVAAARAAGLSEREAEALIRATGNLSDDEIRFLQSVKSELDAGKTVSTASKQRVQQIVSKLETEARTLKGWSTPNPGGAATPDAEIFTGLTPAQQIDFVVENVQGLTKEQATFLIEAAQSRGGTVVFGGSRVRGTARIVEGKVVSDLDVGFEGLTPGQINKIVNNFNKRFTGSSQGAGRIIEHTWIYPGSKPRSIPEISSPEEFFGRSGIRADGPNAGEAFGPSGSIKVTPDGNIRFVRPPDGTPGASAATGRWGLFRRGPPPQTEQFVVYEKDPRIVGYIRPSDYDQFVASAEVMSATPGERTLIVIGHGGADGIGGIGNPEFSKRLLAALDKPMPTRPGGAASASVSSQASNPKLVVALSCEQGCSAPLKELAGSLGKPVVGTPGIVSAEEGSILAVRELRSWRDGSLLVKELEPSEAFTVAYPNDLRVIYIKKPERLFPGIETQGRTTPSR